MIHFSYVLMSFGLMLTAYQVFSFFNMQYEIREMFVVLAALIYFHQLIQTQRSVHETRGD